MVLTCDDRESPSEMMRLTAVVGNCVLLSAVVTGSLPQLCPRGISERTARIRFERTCGGHTTQAWSRRTELKSTGAVQPEPTLMSCLGRAAGPRVELPGAACRGARSVA